MTVDDWVGRGNKEMYKKKLMVVKTKNYILLYMGGSPLLNPTCPVEMAHSTQLNRVNWSLSYQIQQTKHCTAV